MNECDLWLVAAAGSLWLYCTLYNCTVQLYSEAGKLKKKTTYLQQQRNLLSTLFDLCFHLPPLHTLRALIQAAHPNILALAARTNATRKKFTAQVVFDVDSSVDATNVNFSRSGEVIIRARITVIFCCWWSCCWHSVQVWNWIWNDFFFACDCCCRRHCRCHCRRHQSTAQKKLSSNNTIETAGHRKDNKYFFFEI